MRKKMKKIVISSMIESIGFTLLSVAWGFCNGKVYVWFYYPIEITFIFFGFMLIKIGLEIWEKEV